MALICRYADPNDYEAIRSLASHRFPEETLLPRKRYETLLRRDPPVTRVIEARDANGRKRIDGYFALWPLGKSTLAALAEGRLRERDLTDRDILGVGDDGAEVLYVGDICSRAGSGSGARLIRDLMRELASKLALAPMVELLAAWAFTPTGEKLCERLALRPWNGIRIDGSPQIYAGGRNDILAALAR